MFMGVDVGSSNCKVMVIDAGGQVIASSSSGYSTLYPKMNWAEQHPADWFQAACLAIRDCVRQIAPRTITAMSIAGPAHNVALMDDSGEIIYPTIHWSDLRSVAQSEKLEADCGARIFKITNCRVNPSWTLSQLLWLKENEQAVWTQLRKILVTKDYVRYRFTGVYQTDVYDAIGTQLFDATAEEWSSEICALLDFDPTWLPDVAPVTHISGTLLPEAAELTGLPPNTAVVVGSGDSVVEAFGIGAVEPGHCLVKLGTAANVNLVTAGPCPSRESLTYRHVVDPLWFTITATNSGAATMRWFRDTFCHFEVEQAAASQTNVYELINQLAGDVSAGCNGLLFHPYLMGERSPYWDPHLRGNFFGIRAQHSLHHFARAVLEGVAFSIRDCLGAVRQLGAPVNDCFLIGGGAKSRVWRQILCDVLGQPLRKPAVEDAAFGAALLAGVGVGAFESWESAIQTGVRNEMTLNPDPDNGRLYDQLFEVYRAVAQDLLRHSHHLAHLSGGDPA